MEERKRALVLGRVVAGRLTIPEAALLLGLSERSVWRLKSRFVAAELDPAALAHGNAGRLAAHRLDPALAERVVAFTRDGYAGINDTHLSELLAEREGICLSRSSVRRILRGAGITSTRRRRAPTYRSRRERRSAAGMLVQLDASRHRWFGGDGPYASPHGAIDDATGEVLAAVFREEEDAAGYFTLLGQILAARGVPLAAYSDRHGVFWRSARERESIEEELLGRRQPTQLGRAFAECETQLILANSPQAKGRVERLFGTFQDRLVSELRLAGITDLASANVFLGDYLARHNARFAVAPADGEPAWRAPRRRALDRERLLLQVQPRRRRRQHRATRQRDPAAAAARARQLVQPARRAASVPRRIVQRARAWWSRARTLERAGHAAQAARTRMAPRTGGRCHAAAA